MKVSVNFHLMIDLTSFTLQDKVIATQQQIIDTCLFFSANLVLQRIQL